MKKYLLLVMACAIFFTGFANEVKPVYSKTEAKIEKALIKIDLNYKNTKDEKTAFSNYKKLTTKFGAEDVHKVMLILKSCNQTCLDLLTICKRGCWVSVGVPSGEAGYYNLTCVEQCEMNWFGCWLGCGGIWGSKIIN